MATISSTIKIYDGFSSTLSKLGSGLSKGESGFQRFKSVLNGGGAFSGLTKSAGQAGGLFKSVLGGTVVGAGITKGIGLATAGITSMVGELNESSKAWQTFDGNMQMMGKSPKQIAVAKGSMQKFAQQTIYSASDMASTYSQLAAVGIKGTGKLVKGFGGLAAASDNPQQAMKTLSQQATQMAAKPMVQWQDFKLMLEQTPAGVSQVAKTMGMSTKDLVSSVQDGKIATQDFFNAISSTGTNKYFSKMATQYKTVGQAMDGLKETVANKMQGAFDRVGKVGIKMVSNLTDSIGNINFDAFADKAMIVIGKIKQGIGDMFSGFKSTGALDNIKTMFDDLGNAGSKIFGKMSGGKNNIFSQLGAFAGSSLSGVVKSISAIAKVISRLSPGTITALGSAFIILKGGLKGLVFTAIINGISKLKPSTITKIAGTIKNLAVAFIILKAAMKIGSGISNFSKMFKKLKTPKTPKVPKTPELPQTPKTGGIIQSASAYMKLGAALMMVGAGVALAGGGMLLMAMATQKIASGGGAAIAVFFGMFAAIAILAVVVKLLGPEFIVAAAGFLVFSAALLLIGVSIFIASAGIALLATQLPLISQYGVSAAVGLLALAGAIAVFGLAAIVGAVGVLALGIAIAVLGVGFVVGAIGAILFGAALLLIGVGAMVAAVGTLLLGAGLMIVAVMSMLAAVGLLLMAVALIMIAAVAIVAGVGMMIFAVALMMAAPLMMIAAIGALLLGVAAINLGAGLIIVGVALMIVASGLTMVASAVITLATAFIMAGTMMVTAIVSAMSRVVTAVSSGIQNAVNAAKGFVNSLVSVGKDLIQGLVNGIKSMIGSAVSAVKSVAGKVVSAAKSVLHIGSPSKLFNQYGRWVDQGLINGLNRDSGAAADASANMAQGVVDAASNMNPQIGPMTMSGLANNPGDMLANGFQRALGVLNTLMTTFQGLNGSNLGVNGTIQNDLKNDDPVIGAGGIVSKGANSSTTSNSQSTVNISPGAIQINSTGNENYDGEKLVSIIEQYLIDRNNASLG
ncbi:tape measure protein [Companilactobacillus kimchiensis]|uniref:Minor tail protein n=1 Tax=Companilactobacillus kimchiensis TaxID=993692 RepID=A0A0R2LGF0_9LACO|nr:tape measure protein [Companilactobacillus kimchiensis]KRO00889.1 minor tail protein [Companilactobacillus kimchiensis]